MEIGNPSEMKTPLYDDRYCKARTKMDLLIEEKKRMTENPPEFWEIYFEMIAHEYTLTRDDIIRSGQMGRIRHLPKSIGWWDREMALRIKLESENKRN